MKATGLDEVASVVEDLAPASLAESWDNPGWQVKASDEGVSGVLIALDASLEVLDEATRLGCNLLVTHHPAIFKAIRSVDSSTPQGRLIATALQKGISVLSAHTNLDVVPEGTSHALALALGLKDPVVLARTQGNRDASPAFDYGYGAVGALSPKASTAEIARRAAGSLSSAVCTIAGSRDREHQRVAVVGGSGAGFLADVVRSGATLFITADVRYHDAQDAVAQGLDLIILDHYATERPVLEAVRAVLRNRLGNLPVHLSSVQTTPYVRAEP